MKILVEKEVIEQALGALEELHFNNRTVVAVGMYESATADLRKALAEQAEQEPVDLGQIIADKTAQIETYGIEQWTYRPTDAQRYQRLRILGAAPTGSDNLQRGTVLCFQSLDEFIDNDIRVNPSRGEAGPVQQAEQEPVALHKVVEEHIADLRACVPTLRQYPEMASMTREVIKAANELEAALKSEQAEQEPVGYFLPPIDESDVWEEAIDQNCPTAVPLYAAPVQSVSAKPLCWAHWKSPDYAEDPAFLVTVTEKPIGWQTQSANWFPLYTAPVRTKDLTDEEQLELARSSVGKSRHWLVAAVIAKFKEINNL